ncbi:MerR family transcriptional regulator [Pseudomonas sp. CBMAI 2609]|uniref:MerR family transcriptional regulator n=1 Tax=Pseudomonas flavocrustae TaxID=2991719 RepID=A0ABT6II35_9PSED|nr:MerR family transcriptional regulator [Pseudomonas sp. CBMAI 2609]MDH4764108.1 MerR family transcriptional regulator [Pseudomonas sp. CBMAI 2609]
MTAAASSLSIGQLATATGVSVRSLRHYEAQGLLVAGRGTNGYRHFPASAVAQVRQLQRLLGAGFSLAEIRSFPDCMRLIEGTQACPETSAAQRRAWSVRLVNWRAVALACFRCFEKAKGLRRNTALGAAAHTVRPAVGACQNASSRPRRTADLFGTQGNRTSHPG